MMAAACQPAVVRRRMVGDVHGIEARRLDGHGHFGDGVTGHELVRGIDLIDRNSDGVAHGTRTLPSP